MLKCIQVELQLNVIKTVIISLIFFHQDTFYSVIKLSFKYWKLPNAISHLLHLHFNMPSWSVWRDKSQRISTYCCFWKWTHQQIHYLLQLYNMQVLTLNKSYIKWYLLEQKTLLSWNFHLKHCTHLLTFICWDMYYQFKAMTRKINIKCNILLTFVKTTGVWLSPKGLKNKQVVQQLGWVCPVWLF